MLTKTQLNQIEILQKECEDEEQIQLKLNWETLRQSENKVTKSFLHYDEEQLVGFLGVYDFGNKAELCGMVKPDYRGKGIFSSLFNKAIQSIKNEYSEILLNAPGNSELAKGFLQKVSCQYFCSEYQMQWHETDLEDEHDVTLRPSTPNDLEDEIQLDVQCFGYGEEDARKYHDLRKERESNGHMIIEKDGNAVGKIRVSHSDGEAWIYGFAVFPKYQGKGIGRRTLTKVILQESKKGFPIFLEVEAKNDHALGLYESCGFKAYYAQDYYKFLSC